MPINQSDGRTTNSTAAVKNMTSHPLYTVDVFSQRKYTGNQLAVVDEAHRLSPDVMQQIAQEMNYSETTFITDPKPSEAGHRVRIFTPQTELPFAGHPTLGTAFVIREYVIDGEPNEIVLNLDVGSIRVTIEQNDMGQDIYWMEQQPPTFDTTIDSERAARIVTLDTNQIDPAYEPQVVSTGIPTLIIPMTSIEAVREAEINGTQYENLVAEYGAKEVFVFSSETVDSENDIHARMFAPALGVPEDPATGSANGCLAGYLAQHHYFEAPSVEHSVEQGYEIERPSLLRLRADATGNSVSVSVGGQILPVSMGELL
ncbi:PhzF family phenazine biosynthesis protein (plasmid) [Halococcus dombrowskii]|uniref:PhzF family phenazine biosynthesis protein n=1 Tax=Halococcus dombrowskii TaxID=179637 RepID=A0AAV3SIM7_HALDO|nr:PhzF family phenazine biosynthesis protein [Halococcus dombrowskii]UOO97467.1 PhzF family phenazine biosynthesis protein [Halococcus dombrowskii]